MSKAKARQPSQSQVAMVSARGKVFPVATHAHETDKALLERVQGFRVVKRINTNLGERERKANPTVSGLRAELSDVDRDIADLETDPFYRETPGRKAYARKWLAYHKRQRKEIERLLRGLEQAAKRRANGIVEAAAGLQALEYIGAKARRGGLGRKPKYNPRRGSRDAFGVWHAAAMAENPARITIKAGGHRGATGFRVFGVDAHGRKPSIFVRKRSTAEAIKKVLRDPGASRDGGEVDRLIRAESTRANPSVQEVSRMFQGEANGDIDKMKASDFAPGNLARIGKLVFLQVEGQRRPLRIPGAMVAADTRGRLWIVGNRTPLLNQKAKPGEALDFGELRRICYDTAKAHIGNGKRFEYVHEFGEDGGKRPHLLVDHEGMPILRGGDYRLEARGIVN